MLAVGEETGAVDDLLAECAAFYEREVDYDVKNLSHTIEPVLIVFVAGFVLLFALGIFCRCGTSPRSSSRIECR